MSRKSVEAKARRLLPEGRLIVERVDGDLVVASCRGDSGEVYTVGHDPGRGWHCSCPARGTCSHLRALMLVVVRRATEAGISVPIIPGVMPVTNFDQIQRFTQICGASIPGVLRERLQEIEGDPQEVFWTGVSYAAHQCRALLSPPVAEPFSTPRPAVPGIHFYTLNKSPATRAIFEILRLAHVAV